MAVDHGYLTPPVGKNDLLDLHVLRDDDDLFLIFALLQFRNLWLRTWSSILSMPELLVLP